MGHNVHNKSMPHLLEVLKIVEGAVNADRGKVAAYAEQLALKLETDGEGMAADRLRRTLAKAKTRNLDAAQLEGSTRIPVDSESRLSLADEQYFEPDEVVVFLAPEIQHVIDEFIRFVRGADRLLNQGVGISPSLLLYGPPGCGKTELSRHIAGKLRLPLITARTDALISSYLGSTAKNLRLLFEHAMARPCVLFLDEFDAVAKLRDDKHELGELKRVVVSLLQNIDALDSHTVLLAATNHEHLLDSAIWRRFAFTLRIDSPKLEARHQMFRRFLENFSTDDDIALLASVSDQMTGADIRQVAEDSKRSSILDNTDTVSAADVVRRLLRLRLPQCLDENEPLADRLRKVRNLGPKVFSYRRLSEIFGISVGHISNLLSEQGALHGPPDTVTDQGRPAK